MANAETIEHTESNRRRRGVAGLTAAHRLLQRGYDVTLIEANDFLGGKLAAHCRRDDATTKKKNCLYFCKDQGGCLRRNDWHEHCYHMYLNWYHNFWDLMEEVGILDSLVAQPAIYNIRFPPATSGPPRLTCHPIFAIWACPGRRCCNMFAGPLSWPADMMLLGPDPGRPGR